MGFEYQKAPFEKYGKWTYSDDLINLIFKNKSNLEIDIRNELETLKNLYSETEKENVEACKKRDSIADWDSPEAEAAEDLCDELYQKLNSLEDWIDYFEELLSSFNKD